MKLSLLLVLPALASAFAPSSILTRPSLRLANKVTEVTEKVVEKTEEVIGKADDIVLTRAMRFVDHAPILITLRMLARKAGSTRWGIDMRPAAALATPFAIPAWTGYIWSAVAACELASVAKSALADGGNELSQADISAMAISNAAVTAALVGIPGCGSSFGTMALAAMVTSYSARRGGSGAGEPTIHNLALQLMSSFTTVLAVLGGVTAVTSRIGILDGRAEVVKTLAAGVYYVLASRTGNGTVKKAVNAGVIGGIVWAQLAANGLALTTSSLLSVSLIATSAVAFVAARRAKDAVMA